MNYSWEIVLRAKDKNLIKQDLFFKAASNASPYYEQAFSMINQTEIIDCTIELNPLYRFDYIFNQMLHCELKDLGSFRDYLFDLTTHFLCDVDLYQGLTCKDIYLQKLKTDILHHQYGDVVENIFKLFTKNKQQDMIIFTLIQLEVGSSLHHFRRVVHTIYPECLLYQMKEEPNLLIVYLPKQEKNEGERLNLMIYMFLPIGYKIRIFWENHFGVLNIDPSMQLENIELF